jgi:hypothetical protein
MRIKSETKTEVTGMRPGHAITPHSEELVPRDSSPYRLRTSPDPRQRRDSPRRQVPRFL